MFAPLLALALFAPDSNAQERWLPEFGAFEGRQAAPFESFLPAAAEPVEEIRVQVFPHVGKYAVPQGVDTVIDSVSLHALSGECRAFEGPETPPLRRADFVRPSAPVTQGTQLVFKADTLSRPLWVECDGATEVLRAGHKPIRYSGAFFVERHSELKAVRVILLLPFEEYLKGVVPAEMPASWASEALRAQAVAARSYALYQAATARRAPSRFDVDDTVYYQAYLGDSGRQARTDAAVDATRGEVLLHRGTIARAFFSGDAGGHTEDANNVWPGDSEDTSYCQAKPEPFKPGAKSHWKMAKTLAEMAAKLSADGHIAKGSRIRAVSVLDRFPSGRARLIRLTLGDRSEVRLLATAFRLSLGLRSTLFSMSAPNAAGTVSFAGRGWGHGAGMGQEGAQHLALALGWDYRRILGFYYTNVTIEAF